MRGPTVAVHGARWGDGLRAGLQATIPEVRFVLAGTPEAESAEVLCTLVDEPTAIKTACGPGVRWIHVLGAGVDGFPSEVARERLLTCSRGAAAPAIAEFVLGAMLAFEKHIPEVWLTEPPEQWNVADLGGLSGKRLGLVGIGAIGCEVARRALAFDIEVTALRRRPVPAPIPGVDVVADLRTLVSDADHVVVAAPATPATHHLFDAETFAAMKPTAHLVNVARGTLVDQTALLSALDGGNLALATLDATEPEPLPAGHALYRHPRVRLSPHVSWSSPGTARRTMACFAENLERYRAQEPLQGVVDREAGY